MRRRIEPAAAISGSSHDETDAAPTIATRPEDLATRHAVGVNRLFEHHGELRGVHAFADIVEQAARWSA